MRLSDYFHQECILRDCNFSALGLSNTTGADRMLSFLDSPRYGEELKANPNICAVICTPDAVETLPARVEGVVVSAQPRRAYFELHNRLAQGPNYAPQLTPSVIPAGCTVSPLASIDPMGVELGEGVVVEEFVSIKGPCRIGAGTVLHAGARIGGAGYEFKYFGDEVLDVAHCGGVEIGESVIIWENATIHRAVYPWDATRIGDKSRVGAQSHIDHGAKIGRCVKVCAGCVVSGRAEIGDHAYLGPGTVLSNRIQVGESAHTVLGSVVTKDVPAGETVSGNFAIDHQKHLQALKKRLEA